MSTTSWILVIGFVLVVSAAFGYLPARTAERKGYNKWLFWAFATVALFPATFIAGVLPDRRGQGRVVRTTG